MQDSVQLENLRLRQHIAELEQRLQIVEKEKEESIRAIVGQITNAIIVSRDGIVRFVNQAGASFLERDTDELIGEHLGILMVAGDQAEVTIVQGNGSCVVAEMRLIEIEWEGEPVKLAVFRDITKQKQIEQEVARQIDERTIALQQATARLLNELTKREHIERHLREQESRFRLLAEHAPDIVFRYRLGPTRGFEYISPSCATIIGYTPEEYYADPDLVLKIVHPESRHLYLAYQQSFMSYEKPLILHCVRKDGQDVWIEQRTRVIVDEFGHAVALEGIARDITARKQVESELYASNMLLQREIAARKHAEYAAAQKTDELLRSNQELEYFAYIASHDLQEPLRMVNSYVQLLADDYRGKLDADADEYIAYATEGVQRMSQMINALLQYSRVGTKGKELVLVDSNDIVQRAVDHLRMTIEENDATITWDALPVVKADDLQLERVFLNLLGNAIKFRRIVAPVIHISAYKDDEWWVFAVCDNGIGIEPAFAERIFGIFQRLHRHTDYPGTGIGLAICKKIIERHGGRMWVDSQPEQGATFFFTLQGREP